MTASVNLDAELGLAVQLAERAGREIMVLRAAGVTTEHKADNEPVTVADRQASALIVAGIGAVFPGDVVVSEEGADDLARTTAPRVWFVDPIDGTRDFIDGGHGFAVMIGLCVDGLPRLGVVHLPSRARTYLAAPGIGAEVRDATGVTPLRVSPLTRSADARLVASKSHRTADIDRAKAQLGIRNELNIGSIGVKLCLIADNQRDLYVNPQTRTKLWDTCAPQAILEAAGGTITTGRGDRLDYRRTEMRHTRGLIASNGLIHADAVSKLADLFPLRAGRPAGHVSS